jgi:hypothetical protein
VPGFFEHLYHLVSCGRTGSRPHGEFSGSRITPSIRHSAGTVYTLSITNWKQ